MPGCALAPHNYHAVFFQSTCIPFFSSNLWIEVNIFSLQNLSSNVIRNLFVDPIDIFHICKCEELHPHV